MNMVHPKPVAPGAAVCFTTPSLPIKPNPKERIDRRQACVDWAAALGLEPVFTPNFAAHGEVQSPESRRMRLDDLNFALDYPFVSIVGGGGGAISLLDGIDYDKARRNRPVVMGMSDQTKIVNAIAARAELVTFYGPNGGFGHWYQADGNPLRDFFVEKTIEEVRSAVWGRTAQLRPTGKEQDAAWQAVPLHVETFGCPDVLEGVTFGGHWAAAAQMLSGTEYFPRPEGRKLVFLEALHDEILPNLIAFERMRVLGCFRDASLLCGGQFWEKQPVRRWLIEYCQRHDLPLAYQLRFGHMHPISVLPVGAEARFDTRSLELTW
jgi:muramoyltetrapeptide carboxypeptidase LdcA involved in peptidoglycan recycling